MKIATGKIVGRQVVVEGDAFDEGATVTVLGRDDDETFEITPAQEAELFLSIGEAERGEAIPAVEFLKNLRRHT